MGVNHHDRRAHLSNNVFGCVGTGIQNDHQQAGLTFQLLTTRCDQQSAETRADVVFLVVSRYDRADQTNLRVSASDGLDLAANDFALE